MDNFNTNKLILSFVKNRFINERPPLIEVVKSFSWEISPSRNSLCESFRLFGNSKHTWFSGGEDDVQALCEAVMTGYQSASARHFKNDILSKVKIYITENNKDKFFDLCQSIYRSAQQNAPFVSNTDNESQFISEEDFYEIEEEIETVLNPKFGDLLSFYIEVPMG